MDPTAVQPPSPEKSPPQNPHSTAGEMTGAFAIDCYQKGEPSTSRNMDNFRALVLKFAGRLLPAQQSLIEGRLDDFFPNELLVPDHPPYADMILTALWELNTEGGSSEEAISNFIKKEHHELPWAHATILNHHLKDLCVKGEIVMTRDRCYLRHSSTTKPAPSPGPCHNLRLNHNPYSSPVSSPCSSPCSSPSASLCSSPSSSGSSFCWSPPYKKRQSKRKRKKSKGRGCKMVRVGRRGRPPGSIGRGRPQPRMVQVRRSGRARGIIQASQQEDSNHFIDIDDVNKLEGPKQVNEVTGIEDGSKGQNRPWKQYSVMWVGRGEHKKEKGECAKPRRSGRKQNDSKEQHEEGNKEQDRQRKCNVVWIGRGVRKLKETGRDLLEDADLEGLNQKDENGASVECNESENQQYDVMSVRNDEIQLEKQEVEMGDEQDSVTMQCVAQVIVASAQNQHGEQNPPEEQPKEEFKCYEQQKGENSEQEMLEKQFEMVDEPLKNVRNDEIQLEKQEVEMGDEQDSVTMQCEAQVIVTSAQSQHDEQIPLEEQPKEGNKEEFKPYEQQKGGSSEQEVLEKQVEIVDEPLKSEEIQKERVESVEKTEPEEPHDDVTEELVHPQEQRVEGVEEEFHTYGENRLKNGETESAEEGPQKEQQTEVMNQSETEVTTLGVDQNESKEQQYITEKHEAQAETDNDEHNNKSKEHQDQLEKQEAETSLQEESELMNNINEVTQDLMMIQVEGTSVEHNENQEVRKDENESNQSEESKNGVTVKEYPPQEQSDEEIKEQNEPKIQQIEESEKDPLQEKNDSPCESSGVEKVCAPDHKNRPLRQGLRSSCKKEEATPNAENQLEQVTPVRRSLRPRKTISEAAAIMEGLDRSKEQPEHSGRTRSSKRKPKNTETEQVSKSHKTGRTDL